MVNPENGEPPKVVTSSKAASPQKVSRIAFFNYVINIQARTS